MRKTSISNKLNHKPQAHARGVRRKRRKFLKNDSRLKYFAVKRSTLEACRRTVTQRIAIIFATQILHGIKVLVL